MITGRNKDEIKIIKLLEKYKQNDVFYFWEELNDTQRDILINELKQINPKEIEFYFNKFKNHKIKQVSLKETGCFSIFEDQDICLIKNAGIKAVKSGNLAFLTVAGGQGSRLGYEHPKGFFPISPIKQKPLFQIFAEKIKFYSDYYKTSFKWFIMTSELNYNEINEYFIEKKFFDLKKEDIYFFKQGTFPSLTLDGKFILEEKHSIFSNPDGHGGVVKALIKNKMTDIMKKNGISILMYFQIDNPLVKLVDPYFIGYHLMQKSFVSSKVIKKEYPEEKLGSIGKINGKNSVIEYSDLSKEDMFALNKNGHLKYLMGSIAIHLFDLKFLSGFSKKMPLHFAVKKIKGYDLKKEKPEIIELEGIKFEKFVFDTIPLAKKSVFYETLRDEEFFPLKNKTGVDSIDSCITGQSKLFFKWLKNTDIINEEYNNQKLEISPLFAPDFDIFYEKLNSEKEEIMKKIYNQDGSIKNEIYID